MKRLFLTVMAILSLTMTFAENEKASNVEAVNAYNFEVNFTSLANYLNLSSDQLEAVKDIHSEFCANMMNASGADAEESKVIVKNAVYRDLTYMGYILTKKQYHDYLKVLNATFTNRGLNK